MLCNSNLQLYCETFQNQQSEMRKEESNVCTGTGYSEVTAHHWNSRSHLAVVGTIQQDVSCCKISVDKPFLGEVDHTCNYLTAEFQKLHRTHCLQCPGERGCRYQEIITSSEHYPPLDHIHHLYTHIHTTHIILHITQNCNVWHLIHGMHTMSYTWASLLSFLLIR